jgi:hypothetical protein
VGHRAAHLDIQSESRKTRTYYTKERGYAHTLFGGRISGVMRRQVTISTALVAAIGAMVALGLGRQAPADVGDLAGMIDPRVTQANAQHQIATDWRAAYRAWIGPQACGMSDTWVNVSIGAGCTSVPNVRL